MNGTTNESSSSGEAGREPVWVDEAMVHLAYSHLKSKQPEEEDELLELLEGVYKRQLSPTLPSIQLHHDCLVIELLLRRHKKSGVDSSLKHEVQTMVDRLFPSLLELMRQTAKTGDACGRAPPAVSIGYIIDDATLHFDTKVVLTYLVGVFAEARVDFDLVWASLRLESFLHRGGDVVGQLMANSSRILTAISEKFDVWMDEERTKEEMYSFRFAMKWLSKVLFVLCVNYPQAELASSCVPAVCPLVEKMLECGADFEVRVWAAQIYSFLERHTDIAVLERVKNVHVALRALCEPDPRNLGIRNASATLLALAHKDDPTPKRSSQYVFGDAEDRESKDEGGLLPYLPLFMYAEDPQVREEILDVLNFCFSYVDGDEHCWARGKMLVDHPCILRALFLTSG